MIFTQHYNSPVGDLLLAADNSGLIGLWLDGEKYFADSLPDDFRPTTEEREISVSSNRADAIISRVYNLSRDESSTLFGKGMVAINGKVTEKGEKTLKPGDVVTARGYGKFAFVGESGLSKKGKLYVKITVYA